MGRPSRVERRGVSVRSIRPRIGPLIAAAALGLFGLLSVGVAAPNQLRAADSTLSPFTPGRHVYDYGALMSPQAEAIAEKLATEIEADGGGRVVVYTADLMAMPDEATLAEAWHVDGLLLTGWDDMGTATLGATLKGKLPASEATFIAESTSGPATLESWVTTTLARTEGWLGGKHVFDGAASLDATGLAQAESMATALGARIGATVYVDIAIGDKGNPAVTAFFNGADLSDLKMVLVIALAVSDGQIGGYVDSDADLWDSYETHSPWNVDTLAKEMAPNGDVQAELLRAIDGVRKPPDPIEAVGSAGVTVRDALTGFWNDPTNRIDSAAGVLVALLALVGFAFAIVRRRREPGYADDDSVLVSGPPADMTPALAALVAAPLDTTRAVTVALLDLAAHGHIAFYQEDTALGPRGGIKLVSATGASGRAGHAAAASRPLGPAEQYLLRGLVAAAGVDADLSPTDFAELRPLFEQTGEQLEQIAERRGWLRIQTRSMSWVWIVAGGLLLTAAVTWAWLRQPVASASEALAALIILPRATRMPLPLKTPDGAITSAMIDAYRRTLKRALAGAPGEIPPWLANAEEASLWGYAWGLEGDVQAFVGRNVGQAMHGESDGGDATVSAAGLTSFTAMMGGISSEGSRPVGLDTDSIAKTLAGLTGR
jgi:hypothetical protein